jgi:N-methylhydantoinase A
VAAECGIDRILVPGEPGTLCARGILLSDVSLDLVRSEITLASEATWPGIVERFGVMRQHGEAWLDGEHIASERRRFARVVEARYKGQNHEVQVRLGGAALRLDAFVTGFEDAHRREYGYDIPGRAIEVVNCRLKAIGLIDRPAPHFVSAAGVPQPKATRQVYFDAGWIATPIYDRAALAVGSRLRGPAVIEEMSATTLLPPACLLEVDRFGNLLLESAGET